MKRKTEAYQVRVAQDDFEHCITLFTEDRQEAEDEFNFQCEEEPDKCVELIAEYQLRCRPCKAERESAK